MKNKLLKGAHLSERKYREILQLFCDDLTATQIAEISGISRVTINNYFKLIRNRVASYCEENKPFIVNAEGVLSLDENDNSEEYAYYAFSITNEKVQTQWLKYVDAECLQQFKSLKSGNTVSKELLEKFGNFQAIADCTSWSLYLADKQCPDPLAHAVFLSDMNHFWQHTKGRLLKFRGMSKKTLYLHIKECEFRYNFRNEDLFPVIMNIINVSDKSSNSFRTYNLAL